jgi:hypothetical protein
LQWYQVRRSRILGAAQTKLRPPDRLFLRLCRAIRLVD